MTDERFDSQRFNHQRYDPEILWRDYEQEILDNERTRDRTARDREINSPGVPVELPLRCKSCGSTNLGMERQERMVYGFCQDCGHDLEEGRSSVRFLEGKYPIERWTGTEWKQIDGTEEVP